MSRAATDPDRGANVAYTDGACRGNPGPGGWAWAVPGGRWESGYDPATTNQRMEITAALRAVESLEGAVHVVSDSTYVVNCFRDEWWRGWIARGWRNSKKEPVANRDLWEPFVELVQQRDVTFSWVKGHSGDPMNDLVDQLAVAASQRGAGASGEAPPTADDLADPGARGSAGERGAGGVGSGGVTDGGARRDSRIPVGTPWAVVGLRSEDLAGSARGDLLRRQLAAILGAQATLHPDLVVLTGLRPGTESIAALAAADAGVAYAAVLPYPDPVAGWSALQRAGFDAAVAGASQVITLERSRPGELTGRRAAMQRRDGWLRSVSRGAVVVTDGRDPDAELLLRRFTESLGDDVWTIELDEL